MTDTSYAREGWEDRFLAQLRAVPNVAAAARAAGVSRRGAYNRREADPAFTEAWDDAVGEAVDAALGEAYRRGKDGVLEPVYQGGEEVGEIRRYSDALLARFLGAHIQNWRTTNTRLEHEGGKGAVSAIEITLVRPEGAAE